MHVQYFFLLLALLSTSTSAAGSGAVIASNFPDPCIEQSHDGTWYAFSTHSDIVNIQMASSPDFKTWTLHEGHDALPNVPAWAVANPHAKTWAPDVNLMPDGKGWIMYFAALSKKHPKRHCIGAATSKIIRGPYQPHHNAIVCDLQSGGNIDPNLFVDPITHKSYLVYKSDGNAIGHGGGCGNTAKPIVATPLYLQQLDPSDLITPIGDPVFLISNIAGNGFVYDNPNVERPSIAYRNSTYYLLYNTQCYASLKYRIDFISCVNGRDTNTGIAGCDWAGLKSAQQGRIDRTLLETGDAVSGRVMYAPGSVDTSEDGTRIVFHGDTNPLWFESDPQHRINGKPIRRQRGMYAGQIEYGGDSGLEVTKLF